MSYDIWAECPHCHTSVCESWNYTSNCAEMWRKAGADLAAFDGRPVSECAPVLSEAIERLEASPGDFTPMNPPNGWGSYETLVPRLKELYRTLRTAEDVTPGCVVKVWR